MSVITLPTPVPTSLFLPGLPAHSHSRHLPLGHCNGPSVCMCLDVCMYQSAWMYAYSEYYLDLCMLREKITCQRVLGLCICIMDLCKSIEYRYMIQCTAKSNRVNFKIVGRFWAACTERSRSVEGSIMTVSSEVEKRETERMLFIFMYPAAKHFPTSLASHSYTLYQYGALITFCEIILFKIQLRIGSFLKKKLRIFMSWL